ncbi:protein phosphatase 2C domain-containing protein [Neolewinella aurantiaca]|uniref:protein phosphatase 2C domain-containing protein n=1 Tax=Neolewinella aurantiaca TaxID=2602767 RepID=UPI0021D3BABB|nr:protein phosphatase 2C domain-containing protein [Neolewinella aurantiaca]
MGAHHTDHNEDAYVTAEISDRHLLVAVMDGCSMGKDSHFASSLIAKVLRRIAKQTNLRSFAERTQHTTRDLLKDTLRTLFSDLVRLNADLDLDYDELLSTLVLAIVDTQERNAEILAIGDGVIACDEEIVEFNHDNKPDYLGYHLHEDFEDYWNVLTQRVSAQDFQDLALATDGVLSFRAFSHDSYRPVTDDELLTFLLVDREEGAEDTAYRRKVIYIKNTFGLEATDDLTVVRLSV